MPTADAHVFSEGIDRHAVPVKLLRYPGAEAGGGAKALQAFVTLEFKIGGFKGNAEGELSIASVAFLFKG